MHHVIRAWTSSTPPPFRRALDDHKIAAALGSRARKKKKRKRRFSGRNSLSPRFSLHLSKVTRHNAFRRHYVRPGRNATCMPYSFAKDSPEYASK